LEPPVAVAVADAVADAVAVAAAIWGCWVSDREEGGEVDFRCNNGEGVLRRVAAARLFSA